MPTQFMVREPGHGCYNKVMYRWEKLSNAIPDNKEASAFYSLLYCGLAMTMVDAEGPTTEEDEIDIVRRAADMFGFSEAAVDAVLDKLGFVVHRTMVE